MQLFEKPWKMWENTKISSLQQEKKEETIIRHFFSENLLAIEMSKNRDTYV